MDIALKQRLVGTAVIVALAVIFIPMIFDSSNMSQNQSISIKIPDEPVDLKHKVLNIDAKHITQNNTEPDTVKTQAENVNENVNENVGTQPIANPIIKQQETVIDIIDNSTAKKPEEPKIEEAQNTVNTKPVKDDPVETKPKVKPEIKPEIKSEVSKQPENINTIVTNNTYRVKFGAFSQQKNAQQLKAKIIHAGYSAIVEKDSAKGLYKVYSQQINTLVAAENLRSKIQGLDLNIGKLGIETLTDKNSKAAEYLLDTGWIIQIGIFSSKANSIKMRNKIRDKGFVTFVDEIENSKKQTQYRVRVGPYATRDAAQKQQKSIQKKMNLVGLIKPHEKQKVTGL
ncbi:hypothetical protein MNBD_GAMMA01-1251 [hydrothermal vent metagenome]|uniref:SPOR domain-containing protein n=1 Tax=hydrothermal vent metagenome TaxID=652676 RepID=A0A3B0VLI7_9ZZZZ